MFFESTYYASPHMEDLLKKEDVTLIELLDDDEVLQEYKSQNKNLVHYFHRADIVEQLVTLIITEPPADENEALRFKHSNIACEILTTEVPDMTERIIENHQVLLKLYSFLEQEPPLNPLLTSFFCKVFGMLIIKKTEQNWFSYQCVCIQVLEFIKTRERFLETVFKHVATPSIMDLLFQIIINVEGPDLKNNLFTWLTEQNMVPRLINILGCDSDGEKHNNVAQFVCDLISHSRSFRQTDLVERGAQKQQDDAGMSLLYALEDPQVTASLLDVILMSSSKESTIVAGIKIVLKLLEMPVINERDVSVAQMLQVVEDNHRKVLLDKLLPQIAHRIKDFHELLLSPPLKPRTDLVDNAPHSVPFGNTRLQVCTMLTVLLRTENMQIEKAICQTDFFVTLVQLLKKYCWNNLLHNQVKTCLIYALTPRSSDAPISALITHIIDKCKIVTLLTECWIHNNDHVKPTQKRGARLGYMGQLIAIFEVLVGLCVTHEEYRALVESSFDARVLDDDVAADRLADWQLIQAPEIGELIGEVLLQRVYLAGIDPYAKNDEDFNNSLSINETEDFAIDAEASERFAQVCKIKDPSASNIDDILSDMLNIDDCDLFDTPLGGARDRSTNDDLFYGPDSDDDDFESRRMCDQSFHDDDDEEDDDDDEDDTEARTRRNNMIRNQLIIEAASDDNANVHRIDNMKFTNLAPWGGKPRTKFALGANAFAASTFALDELNFQSNFPASTVTAVFDPVDPFASSFGSAAHGDAFGFDTSSAFGDFEAVFGAAKVVAAPLQAANKEAADAVSFSTIEAKATAADAAEIPVVQETLSSSTTVEPSGDTTM